MGIAAAYYSQAQFFSGSSLVPGIIIGITTSIILFCSHFHQVNDDLAAGKRSPIVRLGTRLGSLILTIATFFVFALTVIFALLGIISWWTLMIFFSFPVAYQLVTHVQTYHDQPNQVNNCKFIAVRLHFLSGILFAFGLIIPALFQG